jgi:hypothetical protein
MPAKKSVKPKKVTKKKAARKTSKSKKVSKKEVSAIKESPQRACIDCHFLTHDHIDIDENSDDKRLNTAEIIKRKGLLPFYRVQIKKREDSFCSGSDQWLGCYFEHWCEATVFGEQIEYKVVLETDRSDCPDFLEYREMHSFKYGEELLKKRGRHASLGVAEQSNKTEEVIEPLKNGAAQKAKDIAEITKIRGRKPKNPKYSEFMEILGDVLECGENISLGKYVKKVKAEMEKKDLKKKKKNKITGQEEEGLIYTDTTIRTYIQKYPKYKRIQKRREKHKKA